MTNVEKFAEVYEKFLHEQHIKGMYNWPAEKISLVKDKMIAAIISGSYNKDGPAFKATCKELGIKYTYKAINDFIVG